ncbi:hypothetical protein LIPSTDRAFT_26358, partial [Lipomyces starkeyi NRRL Y-11557]
MTKVWRKPPPSPTSRSKRQSLRRPIIPVHPPTLRFSWDGTEGNPERNFSAWKFDLESRFLAMDGISDRFKIATIRANVHGAVRNWFLAHPEWATGNAGTSVNLLHQLEKEFTTDWASHDRATELHTTFQATGESPVDFANRVRSLVVGLQPDPLADAQGLLTLKYCCTSDALRMKLQ